MSSEQAQSGWWWRKGGQWRRSREISASTRRCSAGWVRRSKIDAGKGPRGALTTAEREEFARLKKENRVLKVERDLLKKAAAFFARENA